MLVVVVCGRPQRTGPVARNGAECQFANTPRPTNGRNLDPQPDVLWPIFRQNRHLLHDLPTIGAEVIQQWARDRYGAIA